jgi:hypothetical protein
MEHPIIISQLKELGITDYLLEQVDYSDFGDIELEKKEIAFVTEVYYELEGDCIVQTEDHCQKLIIHPGNTIKDSYNDADENVKTFRWTGVKLFSNSFQFIGSGQRPFLKFVLVTIK